MKIAFSLAKKAAEKGEIPVGAVVVKEKKVIGEGMNVQACDNDPTGHAEIAALREAARNEKNFRLDGCELYSTVKPCFMCEEAIKRARIKKIYYATEKAKESTQEVAYEKEKKHSVKCTRLMKSFFAERRK